MVTSVGVGWGVGQRHGGLGGSIENVFLALVKGMCWKRTCSTGVSPEAPNVCGGCFVLRHHCLFFRYQGPAPLGATQRESERARERERERFRNSTPRQGVKYASGVCVLSECLIGKQKKPILFKVTEPSSIRHGERGL